MGIVAVLVAAAAGFAFGAVWYMTLAKPWVTATGIEVDENGRPKDASPLPFLVSGICMILVAGMMRHIFTMAAINGIAQGAVAGLGVGLFFITPWVAMNYAYAMRPRNLTVIDGGYSTIGPAIVGAVLGAF